MRAAQDRIWGPVGNAKEHREEGTAFARPVEGADGMRSREHDWSLPNQLSQFTNDGLVNLIQGVRHCNQNEIAILGPNKTCRPNPTQTFASPARPQL